MPFTTLATNAHQALSNLATEVSGVQPVATESFSFRTGELTPAQEPVEIIREVKSWASSAPGRFVYLFETEASDTELQDLHAAISGARQEKRAGRAYARLFEPNRVLYVGGSASLGTRFREHLGYASKAVFAMQLAYWANVRDVPVTFTAARYAPGISDAVLGALEDQLWSQKKP